MKLATRDVGTFLSQPGAYAGVLIYGPDQGQVVQRARQIAGKILPDGDDGFQRTQLSLEKLLEDEALLSDELNAMSLMGGRRLIEARDLSDKAAPMVEAALASCSTSVPRDQQHFLLITAGELSPRSPLRKLFEQHEGIVALPCYKEDARSISQLVRSKCEAASVRVPPEAIDFLTNQLAGDRLVAESELDKILLYYHGDSQIEMESLRLLCASSVEIEMDAMCHAFAAGHAAQLMPALDSALSSGVQPIVMLRMIDRLLARIEQILQQMQQGKSADQAVSSLRPPVFFKDKPRFVHYARRWSLKSVAQTKHHLMRLDVQIKQRHEVGDVLLKQGLLRLCSATLKTAAA